MIAVAMCVCAECGRQVMVDHADQFGLVYPIWHTSPTARRCPGTDRPATEVPE